METGERRREYPHKHTHTGRDQSKELCNAIYSPVTWRHPFQHFGEAARPFRTWRPAIGRRVTGRRGRPPRPHLHLVLGLGGCRLRKQRAVRLVRWPCGAPAPGLANTSACSPGGAVEVHMRRQTELIGELNGEVRRHGGGYRVRSGRREQSLALFCGRV